MTNSVDPDHTAPIGAVWSESIEFASILKFVSNVRQLFAADNFNRCHFSDAFFLALYLLNLKLELIDFTSFFSASVVPDLVPAGEA